MLEPQAVDPVTLTENEETWHVVQVETTHAVLHNMVRLLSGLQQVSRVLLSFFLSPDYETVLALSPYHQNFFFDRF